MSSSIPHTNRKSGPLLIQKKKHVIQQVTSTDLIKGNGACFPCILAILRVQFTYFLSETHVRQEYNYWPGNENVKEKHNSEFTTSRYESRSSCTSYCINDKSFLFGKNNKGCTVLSNDMWDKIVFGTLIYTLNIKFNTSLSRKSKCRKYNEKKVNWIASIEKNT